MGLVVMSVREQGYGVSGDVSEGAGVRVSEGAGVRVSEGTGVRSVREQG